MANDYYDNSPVGQRFQPGETARAQDVEAKFDLVEAGFDGVENDTDRSLKLPDGESQEISENAAARANKVVGFDANGDMVVTQGFTYRGDWATSTVYYVNDVFRDTSSKNLYVTKLQHTSNTISADVTAGNIVLAINVADVEAAKTAAEAARDKAEQWAEEPEDSAVSSGKFSALHHAAKAEASATDASDSANASAASANFKGDWSSLTGSLSKPSSVRHSGTIWVLLNNLADVTTSEPGVSGDWDQIYFPTFASNARKVLSVNVAEDGVEWLPGIQSEYEEFTASGTFTKDTRATWVYVEAIGGGASGAACRGTDSSGGGGGGGFNARLMRATDITSSVTVTIGSGGASSVNNTDSSTLNGTAGGDSSFGSYVTAAGGKKDTVVSFGGKGGGGERGGNSTLGIAAGGYSSGGGGHSSGESGACIKGGAGGGGNIGNKAGGVSQDGGDGGDGATATGATATAGNGAVPGGGGGGARSDNGFTATSGAGGDGRVRVWQW